MFETRYPFEDQHTGRRGELRIAGGVWHGNICTFEFSDTVFGLAGTIACDWREPAPQIDVIEGRASQRAAQGRRPGRVDRSSPRAHALGIIRSSLPVCDP